MILQQIQLIIQDITHIENTDLQVKEHMNIVIQQMEKQIGVIGHQSHHIMEQVVLQ